MRLLARVLPVLTVAVGLFAFAGSAAAFTGTDIPSGLPSDMTLQRCGSSALAEWYPTRSTFKIALVDAKGRIDTKFGAAGALRLSDDSIVGCDDTGTVYIATAFSGTTTAAGGFDIQRLLPDGTADPSFAGDAGTAAVPVTAQPVEGEVYLAHLAVDATGRIWVTGQSGSGGTGFVVRLMASGALDPTFATNGVYSVPSTNSSGNFAAVQPMPDGGAIVDTYLDQGVPRGEIAIRLTDSGVLDPSWGKAGVISVTGQNDGISLSLAPNGDIYFGRYLASFKYAIDRYSGATGLLDPSWATAGRYTLTGAANVGVIESMAIADDGSVGVVLWSGGTDDLIPGLVRLKPNGAGATGTRHGFEPLADQRQAIYVVAPAGAAVWTLVMREVHGKYRFFVAH